MTKFNLEKCKSSNKGITLIALVITIIVLLILAGITINALTGSDSAPAKANEAKQKQDIGSAKDQIAIVAQNAHLEAYDDIYVKNNSAVSSTAATTTVGQRVINAVLDQYKAEKNAKVGDASIVVAQAAAGQDASITITTRDFTQLGSISYDGGVLTWQAMTENGGGQQGGNETGDINDEDELTGDEIYGKIATRSEAMPNLFIYEIINDPETAEIDGVSKKGKVADNTGTLKVAENSEKATARISGFNYDALLEYLNVSTLDPEDEDYDEYATEFYSATNAGSVRFKGLKETPDFLNRLVIPDKVKISIIEGEYGYYGGHNGNYDEENGKEYEITQIYNLGDILELVGTMDYFIMPDTIEYCSVSINAKNIRFSESLSMNNSPSYNKEVLESVNMPKSCKLEFYDCSNLKKVIIPEGVTEISRECFWNCTSLTSVKIPASVTTIEDSLGGDGAFMGCTSLKSVTIPNDSSLTTIGRNAFNGCTSLTSIKIPASVTRIRGSAFGGCTNLESVIIPVDSSLTDIYDGAFSWCTSLTSIKIPEGVTSIGNSAFASCSSLTSVDIPSSVTSIGGNAFSVCSNLTNIEIPEGVTSIGNIGHGGFFYDCSSLQTVSLPESLVSIGKDSFEGCNNLTTVNYAGSSTQWANISKETGNDALSNATINYGK